jgi:hypothetical protein
MTLSAINTACALFYFYSGVFFKSISVSTLVAIELISISEGATNINIILSFLSSYCTTISRILHYFLTSKVGKIFAKSIVNIIYGNIIKLTISLFTILIFLFIEKICIIKLEIAIFIRMLLVKWGIRRNLCV